MIQIKQNYIFRKHCSNFLIYPYFEDFPILSAIADFQLIGIQLSFLDQQLFQIWDVPSSIRSSTICVFRNGKSIIWTRVLYCVYIHHVYNWFVFFFQIQPRVLFPRPIPFQIVKKLCFVIPTMCPHPIRLSISNSILISPILMS